MKIENECIFFHFRLRVESKNTGRYTDRVQFSAVSAIWTGFKLRSHTVHLIWTELQWTAEFSWKMGDACERSAVPRIARWHLRWRALETRTAARVDSRQLRTLCNLSHRPDLTSCRRRQRAASASRVGPSPPPYDTLMRVRKSSVGRSMRRARSEDAARTHTRAHVACGRVQHAHTVVEKDTRSVSMDARGPGRLDVYGGQLDKRA